MISDYCFSIKLKNTILFIDHRTIFAKKHITIGLTYSFYYECVDLECMQINNISPTQKVYCLIYTYFKCKVLKHNFILPFFLKCETQLAKFYFFLDLVNFASQMLSLYNLSKSCIMSQMIGLIKDACEIWNAQMKFQSRQYDYGILIVEKMSQISGHLMNMMTNIVLIISINLINH